MPNVACLGHGNVRTLLHLISQSLKSSALESLWPVHALALCRAAPSSEGAEWRNAAEASGGAALASGVSQHVGAVGNINRHMAIRALRAAPELCDLHLWTQWDTVFGPSLGPLEAFLAREVSGCLTSRNIFIAK